MRVDRNPVKTTGSVISDPAVEEPKKMQNNQPKSQHMQQIISITRRQGDVR